MVRHSRAIPHWFLFKGGWSFLSTCGRLSHNHIADSIFLYQVVCFNFIGAPPLSRGDVLTTNIGQIHSIAALTKI